MANTASHHSGPSVLKYIYHSSDKGDIYHVMLIERIDLDSETAHQETLIWVPTNMEEQGRVYHFWEYSEANNF